MCLARRGFYDHLEEDGMVYPKIIMQCRAHQTLQLSFSNARSFQTKSEQNYNVDVSCRNVVLEMVPVSCPVGLIQLTKLATMVCLTGHGS